MIHPMLLNSIIFFILGFVTMSTVEKSLDFLCLNNGGGFEKGKLVMAANSSLFPKLQFFFTADYLFSFHAEAASTILCDIHELFTQ